MKRVQPYKQGELFSPAEGNFALPKNKFDQYSKKAERNCSKSAYSIDTVYFRQPNYFKKTPLDSFLKKIVRCFCHIFGLKMHSFISMGPSSNFLAMKLNAL